MYKILYFKDNNKNFYNLKFSLNDKEKYIKKYNLVNKGIVKDYYINNIIIQYKNDKFICKKYSSLNVDLNENMIIEEFNENDISYFNFYETDYEEEYTLYENINEDNNFKLKLFDNYFKLELITNNLNNNIFIYI